MFSKSSALILLGLLVVFIPLSGLPLSWKTPLLVGIGLLIVVIALAVRQSLRRASPPAAAARMSEGIIERNEPPAR